VRDKRPSEIDLQKLTPRDLLRFDLGSWGIIGSIVVLSFSGGAGWHAMTEAPSTVYAPEQDAVALHEADGPIQVGDGDLALSKPLDCGVLVGKCYEIDVPVYVKPERVELSTETWGLETDVVIRLGEQEVGRLPAQSGAGRRNEWVPRDPIELPAELFAPDQVAKLSLCSNPAPKPDSSADMDDFGLRKFRITSVKNPQPE
jgi:hypothetical protein